MQNNKVINSLYNKYEYLSREYAKKVFNYERQGLLLEDIQQEMRIKIYMSIMGYGRAWADYRETGMRKPAPMESWIRLTLANKVKDYIRIFNIDNVNNKDKISIGNGEETVDVGFFSTVASEIDLDNEVCVVNDVDILAGLKNDRKTCFSLFLKGHTIRELSTKFPKINAENLISQHSKLLRGKRNELYDFTNNHFETFKRSEEE